MHDLNLFMFLSYSSYYNLNLIKAVVFDVISVFGHASAVARCDPGRAMERNFFARPSGEHQHASWRYEFKKIYSILKLQLST